MNWVNLHTRTLRSPAYMGSDPVERATWLNILVYSCEQENGGRIAGAAQWKDRQWQQLCGVTRREVVRATRLLTWDGDTLIVEFYPLDKEQEVAGKREAARVNGRRGGRPAKPTSETQEKPTRVMEGNQRCPAEGERKEKGKETEGESEMEEEGEREAEGASSPAAGRALPKLLAEVQTYAAHFPVTSAVPQRPDDGFVEWWFDEQEKRGWCDPETGLPWRDWAAAFRARWRAYVHRQRERSIRPGPPPASSRAQAPQHSPGDNRL